MTMTNSRNLTRQEEALLSSMNDGIHQGPSNGIIDLVERGLQARGLVVRRHGLVRWFYTITPAGREALANFGR